ncbi:MAG: TonB-dependent receptor [Candidatus Neomarinimicrobiota bacterium]
MKAEFVIKGVVVDSENDEGIIGANLLIVGTEVGASTDTSGQFRIEWEGELPVRLRVTHIGYMTREMNVSVQTSLKIRLVPKVLKGREVTVVGERTRAQAEASTAMDVIDIEAIQIEGARDVGSALRRISSVVVDEASSGVQTVSIRGSNSNEVAVYLDGVKINSANTGVADLSQIDLNTLQKIEVLRGGNTYLFGQGNLGGVLNLETRGATRNSLSVDWGDGLSFEDDRDLSLGATGVLGPVGVGGQISGRSREYEGRTLTSSFFAHLLGDGRFRFGKFSGRWYELKNSLTYPSGDVALGDHQVIGSFRYRGDVWRMTGWEFFGGNRLWTETNNFFDNLDQRLDDKTFSYRISKDFGLKYLNATAQFEQENQDFTGDRTLYWRPDFKYATDRWSEISRRTRAFAVVGRWFAEGDSPILRRLQIELSGRMDDSYTDRLERTIVRYVDGDTTGVWENEGENRERFFSRRLGLRMEGLTNQFGYKVFFTQGNNRRLPTLNDVFVKATTYFDSLRLLPLGPESLNSMEVNVHFSFTEFLTTPVISELAFSGAYFRNNYDNKIGYLHTEELQENYEPPYPYNELQADIQGVEAAVQASFLADKLRFGANYTMLDIDNPLIFPNRPGFRYVVTADIDMDWVAISYDLFSEGEQFVMGSSFGRLFEPRRDANLNITFRKTVGRVNLSLSYTLRNLMSRGEKESDSELDILFFNYYRQYREIVILRVSI